MDDILIKALYEASDSSLENIPDWLQDPINVVLEGYVPKNEPFESISQAEDEVNEIVRAARYYGFRQGLRVGLGLSAELDMQIGDFSK